MWKTIKAVFRLIRFPNLVIIAFTQYAMRYLILKPMLPSTSFSLEFGDSQFSLLVLSTMLIAAAGYIINDYFDTRTDLINKPSKVVVGVSIGRKTAMNLHAVLNILGVGLGVYLSFYTGLPVLSLVFILATGLLWFYSTSYKRQFLLGNLTISILTGLVPLMVILFEIPMLNQAYGDVMLRNDASFNYLLAWVGAFSFFAFLSTLIREIVKDAEDFEGDRAYGMSTIPIVMGSFWTRAIIVLLSLLDVAVLLFLFMRFILFSVGTLDLISLVYLGVFLVLPHLMLIIRVIGAREKKHYRRASLYVKLIMLFGILYSVVAFYLITFRY